MAPNRTVRQTDVLQGALMVATAIVTFVITVRVGGGMESITARLAETMPGHLAHPGTKNNFPWPAYFSMIVMWTFFTIGQPTLFTKFFTMNSYRTMFKAVILGTLGMLLSATLIEWSDARHPTDALPDPGHAPQTREVFVAEKLQALVANLPARARMVVVLRFQEEMDPTEIADALDMPGNTVKSHPRRSIAALRERLMGRGRS